MSRFFRFLISFSMLLSSHLYAGKIYSEDYLASLLQEYSEAERELIEADYRVLSETFFRGLTPQESPTYLATAGAPGSHKSTVLETLLAETPRFSQMAYLDPDIRIMRSMVNTYIPSLSFYQVSRFTSYLEAQKHAYTKWRFASLYLLSRLFDEAVEHRYSIAHGTTLTGAKTPEFLEKLKSAGYFIVLVLCFTPTEVRRQAVEHRETVMAYYQSTPEDFEGKEKLFQERMPTYFEFADEIFTYETKELFQSRLVGVHEKCPSS